MKIQLLFPKWFFFLIEQMRYFGDCSVSGEGWITYCIVWMGLTKYATWVVLLPTKEQAAKLAESSITSKFFRLQLEYMGTRRIRVTLRPSQPHRRSSGLIPEQLRKSRGRDITSRCCWDGTRRLHVSHMPKHPGYNLQPGQTNDGGGRDPLSKSLLSKIPLRKEEKIATSP